MRFIIAIRSLVQKSNSRANTRKRRGNTMRGRGLSVEGLEPRMLLAAAPLADGLAVESIPADTPTEDVAVRELLDRVSSIRVGSKRLIAPVDRDNDGVTDGFVFTNASGKVHYLPLAQCKISEHPGKGDSAGQKDNRGGGRQAWLLDQALSDFGFVSCIAQMNLSDADDSSEELNPPAPALPEGDSDGDVPEDPVINPEDPVINPEDPVRVDPDESLLAIDEFYVADEDLDLWLLGGTVDGEELDEVTVYFGGLFDGYSTDVDSTGSFETYVELMDVTEGYATAVAEDQYGEQSETSYFYVV